MLPWTADSPKDVSEQQCNNVNRVSVSGKWDLVSLEFLVLMVQFGQEENDLVFGGVHTGVLNNAGATDQQLLK